MIASRGSLVCLAKWGELALGGWLVVASVVLQRFRMVALAFESVDGRQQVGCVLSFQALQKGIEPLFVLLGLRCRWLFLDTLVLFGGLLLPKNVILLGYDLLPVLKLVEQEVDLNTLGLKFCGLFAFLDFFVLELAYLELQHLIADILDNFAALGRSDAIDQLFAFQSNLVVLICQ